MKKTNKIKKIVLEEYIKIISEQQDNNSNSIDTDIWYNKDYNSNPYEFWTSSPVAVRTKFKYITAISNKNKKYTKLISDWMKLAKEQNQGWNVNNFLEDHQGYFSDQYGNSLNDLIDNLLKDTETKDAVIARSKEKREKKQIAAGTKESAEWKNKKILNITLSLLLSTRPLVDYGGNVSLGFGTDEKDLTNAILSISSLQEFIQVNEFLYKICNSIQKCNNDGAFAKFGDNDMYLFLPKYKPGTTDQFECFTDQQVQDLNAEADASWKGARNVFNHGWLNLDFVESSKFCSIIGIINDELDYKGTIANDDIKYLEQIREHLMKILGNKAKLTNAGWLQIGSEILKLPQNPKYISRRFTDI